MLGVRWTNENVDVALEHCAFLLGSNGKVHSDDDFVYRANPLHKSECVEYIPSQRNAAWLNVDISKIPAEVDKIAFNLSLENTNAHRQMRFGRIENFEMLLIDTATNKQLARFDLNGIFLNETAVVVGELYRHKGEWKFKAVGAGYNGGIEVLCQAAGVSRKMKGSTV